ncbi:TPA: hypothetical protein ACHCBP_005309, partial [Escherichia coli]
HRITEDRPRAYIFQSVTPHFDHEEINFTPFFIRSFLPQICPKQPHFAPIVPQTTTFCPNSAPNI